MQPGLRDRTVQKNHILRHAHCRRTGLHTQTDKKKAPADARAFEDFKPRSYFFFFAEVFFFAAVFFLAGFLAFFLVAIMSPCLVWV